MTGEGENVRRIVEQRRTLKVEPSNDPMATRENVEENACVVEYWLLSTMRGIGGYGPAGLLSGTDKTACMGIMTRINHAHDWEKIGSHVAALTPSAPVKTKGANNCDSMALKRVEAGDVDQKALVNECSQVDDCITGTLQQPIAQNGGASSSHQQGATSRASEPIDEPRSGSSSIRSYRKVPKKKLSKRSPRFWNSQ